MVSLKSYLGLQQSKPFCRISDSCSDGLSLSVPLAGGLHIKQLAAGSALVAFPTPMFKDKKSNSYFLSEIGRLSQWMKSPPSLRILNSSEQNMLSGRELRLLKKCCSKTFSSIISIESTDKYHFVLSKSLQFFTSWTCTYLKSPSTITSIFSKRLNNLLLWPELRKTSAIEQGWVGIASRSMIPLVGEVPTWRCVTLLFGFDSLSLGRGQIIFRTHPLRSIRWFLTSRRRGRILTRESAVPSAWLIGEVLQGD